MSRPYFVLRFHFQTTLVNSVEDTSMRFCVFALSFFSAYLVCVNGLSQCVWHCKEDIDSYFFLDPPVAGQQPMMKCAYFPQKYGKWLYTDLGVNANQTLIGELRPYKIYTKDACDENCWVENGPIHMQDAVHFINYETPSEIGLLRSWRCISITDPIA